MKTNDWNAPDLKAYDWVKTNGFPGPEGYCGARHTDEAGLKWVCSRFMGHEGQHVATAGTREGHEDVCGVWPR